MTLLYHVTDMKNLNDEFLQGGLEPRVCEGYGDTPYVFLTVFKGLSYWRAEAKRRFGADSCIAVISVNSKDIPHAIERDVEGTERAGARSYKVAGNIPATVLTLSVREVK